MDILLALSTSFTFITAGKQESHLPAHPTLMQVTISFRHKGFHYLSKSSFSYSRLLL